MASFSTNGVPAATALSSDQLATLKAYIASQQVSGGAMVGYSNQQIADALNAPTAIPNPQPNVAVVDPIPPAAFPGIVATIAANLRASSLPAATQLSLAASVNNMLTFQGNAPLALNNATLAVVIAQFTAAGFTEAQVSAALSVPVTPAVPPTLPGPSWAYANLGGAWIEPSDLT